MTASIKFLVPTGRLEDLARLIVRDDGLTGGMDIDLVDDFIELRKYLEARAGEFVDVHYLDLSGGNPITDLSELLDCYQAPYFGYWPAYETRDKSRFHGGFIVRHDTEIHGERKCFAWQNGDPRPHEGHMRIAGFSDEHIARIVEQFLPEPKAAMAPAVGG